MGPTLASGYSFEWRKSEMDQIVGSEPVLTVTEQGTYELLVRDEKNGCTASDSAVVSVERISVNLPPRLSLQKGNSIVINSEVESTAFPVTYQWSPPEGLSSDTDSLPSASPQNSMTYVLQVTSPIGCLASDSVQLEVFDRLYIPDAFSPNGDGVNDVLDIYNGSNQIQDIRIINRWGEVVFQSPNYDNPWDGTYKQTKVPQGTYIYLIVTPFYNYKGTILILY
ncbi:gliding motility-associated C-terminal domain-containing protein [Salmonirosea aquatica]|uniref:gliding motility-associated C-terminal domain-containing protein n=1 Tax=Salmonirosea aquatica TaxID=2654236 RepID=UPI003570969B